MAALIAARKTEMMVRPGDHFLTRNRGGSTVFHGALVGDLAGVIVPASADVNIRIIGRASVDDGISELVSGAKVRVDEGVARWVNGDAIVIGDVGDPCYATDDQTVNLSSAASSRPFAGIITLVDSLGVWVDSSLSLSGLAITP